MMTRKSLAVRGAAVASTLATLAYAGLAWAEPAMQTSLFDMPKDVSRDGHRIDWLLNVTNGFVVLLFVIMCVWMGYAVIKHNKDHEDLDAEVWISPTEARVES